eukprot:8948653-Pyramimonas_sp.AAC.1
MPESQDKLASGEIKVEVRSHESISRPLPKFRSAHFWSPARAHLFLSSGLSVSNLLCLTRAFVSDASRASVACDIPVFSSFLQMHASLSRA